MDTGLIILLSIYGFYAVCLIFIIVGVPWSVHISQNKGQNKPYGWGTYKQFIREFNSYGKWSVDGLNGGSFFGDFTDSHYRIRDSRYHIHAGIIQFNDVCMNLYPLSYFRAMLFLKREYKRRYWSKRTKIKW